MHKETQSKKQHVPEMGRVGPIWWHHHGRKIRVDKVNSTHYRLTLAGNAAHLIIESHRINRQDKWLLSWSVTQQSIQEGAKGTIIFSTLKLKQAFGLADGVDPSSQWLVTRYGAESASQFYFIRWKQHLNIPCPGTGNDGDPNISILIDEEIQEAVRQLINSDQD